ncbi:hypothetical protein MTsPCn9_04320 [Croceitalea sp. MTPC9]|uniref:CdaR family protein n=1 Tax=unclassified Croceitalea TaxID=2632280 RepID=UPI002B398CFE|nr:hypothetical protein MTsPCn6_04390 [Croceitalea sp. MTPC6]GMN15496.1 hypothetical protein MTsPCn9_04320 [Croceitalea sp. MTPC9]
MLKKIINGLNKRKVKVFLLFLLCSVLAWSVSKLSESYESRATFELEYTKFPDSLLLNTTEKDYTNAKLRASGFQFLRYSINQKKIKIDLRQVNNHKSNYFLTETELKVQLERQLPNTISLLELVRDTFFVDLYKVALKEVPVNPNITINVATNHILEGELELSPKVVTVKGPSNEIAEINQISTLPLVLNELSTNFSQKLRLILPESTNNTQLLQESVEVSGKIVEFSEKEFNIPIGSENVPEGFRIKKFPNSVVIVCKASIDRLKTMESSDFEAIVDYATLANSSSKYLSIKLKRKPKSAYSVQLLTNQVEFVLEKI